MLVIAVFAALILSHLDAIPFWDAKFYLQCVEDAVDRPFDLLNFRCFYHPSIVSTLLWSVTQYFWPWTPALVYVTNALLGAASIVAFYAIVRLLFPNRSAAEYTVVAALYALAPVFVAHAIFLNVDYGVTAFFVIFLYFLLARRFWLASIFAVAAMFSKETGATAWAAIVLAYVVAFVLNPRTSWPERRAMLRSHTPLAAAPVVLLTYLVWVAMFRPDPAGWVHSYAPINIVPNSFDAFLNTNLADPDIRSLLVDIFVLNYQWLYTVVIVAALCAALIRVDAPDRGESSRDEPAGCPRLGVFLGVSLVGLLYVVTRYRFSNAARYVLLASPVVVLIFYHALVSLVASHVKRLVYLSVCAALVFLSNFRTLDFVSRSIFGTFAFGSHALLDMPSFKSGPRLDNLVYNLEFLQLQYLFGDVIRDLRPRPGSVLLTGNVIYNFPPDVDLRSYELTANPSRALPLLVATGEITRAVLASHMRRDGDPFFYVAFPHLDNTGLQHLQQEYAVIATKRYERRGYALDVYTFRFTFKP